MYTLVFVRGSARMYIGYRDRKKKNLRQISLKSIQRFSRKSVKDRQSYYQIYNMNIEYIND